MHKQENFVQKSAFIWPNIWWEQEIFIPLHRKIKQNYSIL